MSEQSCLSVTVPEAAALLEKQAEILLLCHRYPDGDTLGSAFALCRALQHKGKKAQILCADRIPEKYRYMTDELDKEEVDATAFVCAVDVADYKLLGSKLAHYAESVDLCIDHHLSNTKYANRLLLKDCSATAMIVYEVIRALGVPFDRLMAEAVYTGIATDTGCFKYGNTDASTHRMAAEMLDLPVGVPPVRLQMINREMFDIKSRARIELERMALEGMRFEHGGKISLMPITLEMVAKSGAQEDDMDGFASLPRQIEGVMVGITLRERSDGSFKVSLRTDGAINAADICGKLGGGGHAAAAGCMLHGPLDAACQELADTVASTIPSLL